MSAHLMIVVGYMDLAPTHKLTLMKIADSADDRTRLGFPGLDAVRLWAGTKRSRSLTVLRELQEMGLLMQVEKGRNGHRAVFKVFPVPGDEVFSVAAKQQDPCPGAALFADPPGIPTGDEVDRRVANLDEVRGTFRGTANLKGPVQRTLQEGSSLTDPSSEGSSLATTKGPVGEPEGSSLTDPFGTLLRLQPSSKDDESASAAPSAEVAMLEPTLKEQSKAVADWWWRMTSAKPCGKPLGKGAWHSLLAICEAGLSGGFTQRQIADCLVAQETVPNISAFDAMMRGVVRNGNGIQGSTTDRRVSEGLALAQRLASEGR